jgi:hypothetical protein
VRCGRFVVVAVGAAALLVALPQRTVDTPISLASVTGDVAWAPAPNGDVYPPLEGAEPADATTTTAARPRPTTATTVRVRPATTTTSTTATAVNTAPASSVGAYALHYNDDGSVVRWNPCAPITWKANLALAPTGALAEIEAALAALSAASGLSFVYGGTTTTVPTEAWLHGDADDRTIVVAWVAGSASDLFSDGADAQGGWYEQGASRNGRDWTWQIVRGFVVLDPVATSEYGAGFGNGVSRGALLMHELAHAVGLSHVDDRSQLMYPTLSRITVARYASGDLAGLARLGASAGCIV